MSQQDILVPAMLNCLTTLGQEDNSHFNQVHNYSTTANEFNFAISVKNRFKFNVPFLPL